MRLLSITKLQNLKAIHNATCSGRVLKLVVINHKTTKFESNSQLLVKHLPLLICCYQSQNYKIWKQFTTFFPVRSHTFSLLSITKLRNLKASHHYLSYVKSLGRVVLTHKTTNFESNSQPPVVGMTNSISCYQSQNYEIWKQFTTRLRRY